ncbi:bile acid:sodium symporter family protein [Niallia sp. Krafla_26]|uniref:bile acid:sodium symporter family protein n=1 Tax=Niallia sp. Krafla_26 TaxID=3064703 RepID=UPI003D163D65
MRFLQPVIAVISKFLPLWILCCAVIAYLIPELFVSIRNLTSLALGVIFLLMGMTLSIDSLISVVKNPKPSMIGVTLKWVISVGISILLAYLFFADNPDLAAGIILAGSVSSGTSANLYSMIAGGEVALSLSMATVDTIISPLLTPSLMQWFAGKFIEIHFWSLFLNIIYVVFIPLFLGVFLKWKWSEKVKVITPYTSILSMLALFIVVLSVVSNAQSSLQQNLEWLPIIFIAVFLQVSIPMFLGYFLSKAFKLKEKNCRAILFHTGICNTALAATLAMQHINSIAAVPSVANMIVNLTLGALVANLFKYKFTINTDSNVIESVQ